MGALRGLGVSCERGGAHSRAPLHVLVLPLVLTRGPLRWQPRLWVGSPQPAGLPALVGRRPEVLWRRLGCPAPQGPLVPCPQPGHRGRAASESWAPRPPPADPGFWRGPRTHRPYGLCAEFRSWLGCSGRLGHLFTVDGGREGGLGSGTPHPAGSQHSPPPEGLGTNSAEGSAAPVGPRPFLGLPPQAGPHPHCAPSPRPAPPPCSPSRQPLPTGEHLRICPQGYTCCMARWRGTWPAAAVLSWRQRSWRAAGRCKPRWPPSSGLTVSRLGGRRHSWQGWARAETLADSLQASSSAQGASMSGPSAHSRGILRLQVAPAPRALQRLPGTGLGRSHQALGRALREDHRRGGGEVLQ